jgi:hypothetical protein
VQQAHAGLQDTAISKRTNQAIQGQRLSENEDQDHAHKQLWLLRIGPALHGRCVSFDTHAGDMSALCACSAGASSTFGATNDISPHTSIANDANGHASCKSGQATGQAGGEVCIPVKQVVWAVDCAQCRPKWLKRLRSRVYRCMCMCLLQICRPSDVYLCYFCSALR